MNRDLVPIEKRAVSKERRIKIIKAVTVAEARKHFTGRKSFPKGKGKEADRKSVV